MDLTDLLEKMPSEHMKSDNFDIYSITEQEAIAQCDRRCIMGRCEDSSLRKYPPRMGIKWFAPTPHSSTSCLHDDFDKNDRKNSGGTLRQKLNFGPMDQWTNGPMDQWTNWMIDHWINGPMIPWTNSPKVVRDQWTNGPIDQWTNGQMNPQDIAKISPRYPQNIPKISPRYPQDIPNISQRYP